VTSCSIPFLTHKLWKFLELYSPPPSVLIIFNFNSACLSTYEKYLTKTLNTSLFSFTKYIQIFLVNSSTKETKYLLPLRIVVNWPTHIWIDHFKCLLWSMRWNGFEDFSWLFLDNTPFTSLQRWKKWWHTTHHLFVTQLIKTLSLNGHIYNASINYAPQNWW